MIIPSKDERLGINGVEEIKAHPFFYGVDWKRIREKKAPFVPKVNIIAKDCFKLRTIKKAQ